MEVPQNPSITTLCLFVGTKYYIQGDFVERRKIYFVCAN